MKPGAFDGGELRHGCVQRPKRWSGDTHVDLGGSVDEAATGSLMAAAADAIDQLTAERDVLALRLEKLEALLRKPDVGIFEALDHHGPAEGLLEFVEGLWYTPEGSYLHLDDALEALVP